MNIFRHLIGQTIVDIKRRDNEEDYDYYWPAGLHIIIDNDDKASGLYIGILNDGISTDIAVISSDDLWERNGGEFPEGTFINRLKPDDELSKFIGDEITNIRLAKFKAAEIKGDTFTIIQGMYAGIELTTTNNKLTFYNDDGGHMSINQDLQIPLNERWIWEE
jgi:hypothetical protein